MSLLMKVKESEKVGLNSTFRKVNHGIRSRYFMESERLLFGGAPKSLHVVTAAMKLKDSCSLEEKL